MQRTSGRPLRGRLSREGAGHGRGSALVLRVLLALAVAAAALLRRRAIHLAALSKPPSMPLPEAWKVLGVKPDATRGELKKAFRSRIREVHPDITGDNGEQLQQVRDAYAVVDSLENPSMWDQGVTEEGLPAWASGLLHGVKWSEECPSYAAFLLKTDQKALAVGEMDEKTGIRPWAAVWGKYSQEEANAEALRVCRQNGGKCRLIFVGSGNARAKTAIKPSEGKEEREWWVEQFRSAGEVPGFGWMPMIDAEKERLVGYKTVPGGDRFGVEARVRVPVFRLVSGGLPYYYSPLRPKERIHMKQNNFKHKEKLSPKSMKYDPRIREAMLASQEHNMW